uniref:Putative calpain-like protein n=1 Tax=Trypanosoma congolense (strain IL3000) TaxID=1068625 RepID=G0UJ03_TRYCI|nr:putative calpain-like protein fragment [Trypanosoma congolense IL3000]
MGLFQSKDNNGKMRATPTMTSTVQAPLFNGLLYRLVDECDNTLGFFNNSTDYEFRVTYLFNVQCYIEPLDKTSATEQDDGILCEVCVYPGETQRFVRGEIAGYESKIDAVLLSDEYFSLHEDRKPDKYYGHVGPFKGSLF